MKRYTRYRVTTLVAQWRDARFLPDDIADEVAATHHLARSGECTEALDPASLAVVLNRLTGISQPCANNRGAMSRSEMVQAQYDWFSKRREFERRYPGLVRGGAGVEFSRGFCTIAEILEGIPAAYSETLDLTVCQSVLLGEEIRRRCVGCSVLVNADLTSFDLRFAWYHQAVTLIHRQPQAWEDAVITIRKAQIAYAKQQTRTSLDLFHSRVPALRPRR
jgi:hypothetical protein